MPAYNTFSSSPTSAQFAKAGAWEHAWSFPLTALPDDASIGVYLADTTEVAFEAFFDAAFFGMRFTGNPAAVEAFARACIRSLYAVNDGQSFFPAFQKATSIEALGENLCFAEVGAVNAWRSVGAFRIEQPLEALADFDRLWMNLSRSAVFGESLHPKAIELAFEAPHPHWFGLPVSSAKAPYEVSAVLLRAALGRAPQGAASLVGGGASITRT